MDSSWTRDQTHVPCIAAWILIHSVIGSPGCRLPMLVIIFFLHIDCVILLPVDYSCHCCLNNVIAAATAKSRQLCPILCNPIDGSPPGSSVHGISQARVPEWVAIAFSNNVISIHFASLKITYPLKNTGCFRFFFFSPAISLTCLDIFF